MKAAALPERLLARLGHAVFEDAGRGVLTAVGAQPEWFERVFGAAAAGSGRFVPEECSPFLENFLEDAARAWDAGGAQLAESGEWIERGADGREVALEAEACVVDGRRILMVTNQQERFDETSRRLQTAREEKLAHERLRREIQTKEILLHCIVHDLSQPLTALRGCLSLLTMGLPPEKVREVAEIADRQTRKQEGMIRDVLKAFSSEMAALQSGGAGQTVDVAQGAREVAAEYAAAYGSQGASLALDPRLDVPGEWRAAGEPERLRRMFTNFLENALRYSPAGTTTTVGVEEDGEYLRAFVDDQGPGLPEGVTAGKLFRLFGKGKESTGKAGLGLYFCKITAERWGGNVGCENRAAGGTRFWFRLPRVAAGGQAASAAASAAAVTASPVAAGAGAAASGSAGKFAGRPQKTERPLRILLADDLAINRQVIQELLEQRGHRVEAVDGGRAAVAAAREGAFDVILMDVEMPGMNGLEAARAIRAGELALDKKTPILAVTANDSPDDREKVRNAGMDAHLLKPFGREQLYQAVETMVPGGSPAGTEAAAEPARDAEAPGPAGELTRESIVARFGGDARLAGQLARMFLKDAPRLLGAVRRAAQRDDSEELGRTAHALKGAVGHFGAQEARAAAARLEELGRRGERKGVKQGLAELAETVEALRGALTAMTGKRASAGRKRSRKGRGA